MQDNRRDNEKDVDLTGMIHEYSKDGELRKKIEEMKRQKEGQKAQPVNEPKETYHSTLFDDVRPSDMFADKKSSGMSNIQVDQTELEKTRVGFQDSDANKTLVIMDGKKATSFGDETQTMTTPIMNDYTNQLNDVDKTIVQPISEIEEDGEVHSLDLDDEEEYVERKKNKTANDEKTNKIITYVIVGIVAVVLLIAGFFGMKYLLGGGSSDNTEDKITQAEKDKKAKEKAEAEKKAKEKAEADKKAQEEKDNQNDEKGNMDNNDAAIASLNEQLKADTATLSDINMKISTTETEKNKAQSKLDELLNKANEANRAYSENQTIYNDAEKELKEVLAILESNPADAGALDRQKQANDKKTEAANKEPALKAEVEKANAAYNNSEYKGTVNQAEGKLSELNEQKETYEGKIAATKEKLSKYQ